MRSGFCRCPHYVILHPKTSETGQEEIPTSEVRAPPVQGPRFCALIGPIPGVRRNSVAEVSRNACGSALPPDSPQRQLRFSSVFLFQKSSAKMAGKALKAIVFMGSVRDGRNALRVSKFVAGKLKEAKYDVEVWDPQELQLPLLKQPLQFYPDPSQAPQIVRDLNEKIKAADAFVVLTAEYNRQMPPALTNLLDHFPPLSYAFKASAIVCYSMGAGGSSAAAQARTLLVEFGAPPIPYILQIPQVMSSLDESGNVTNEHLHKAATKMITQLDWFANAFRSQRERAGVPAWQSPAVSV